METNPASSANQTGEQRYRHLFEHAPICIFVIDLNVSPITILEVNKRAELIYGYPAAELVGMPAAHLMPKETELISQAIVKQMQQGQTVTAETLSRRRDGTRFPVRIIAAHDPVDDGHMIVTVEDITSTEQRRTEAEAIDAERRRIAHEIHDSVAQSLAGLRFKSALWSHRAAAAPPGMSAALDELLDVLKTAITDLRRSIFALRPLDLETLGLVPALAQLIEDFGDQGQLAARFEVSGDQIALPADYELPLFRIVQQGLNNIDQHAQASTVLVCLSVDETGSVRVSVQDNGCGFDPHQLSQIDRDSHFGLQQMRERIVDRGGSLDIHSAPGQGTNLIITLPPVAEEVNDVTD